MSMILDGSNGVTFNDASLQAAAASPYVLKNRIINGAMVIDQRNAGASVTQNAVGIYTLDRWLAYGSVTSKFTVQQNSGSVTPPAGFTNYLGCVSSSAYTVGAADLYTMSQAIEGLNIADLGWGTANAQTVTLSFWVRSSLTGTFGGAIQNSAQNRAYPYSYSISAANTWEYKTITIAGDTSGTWLTTNDIGIRLYFSLGTGTTYSGAAGSWSGNFYTSVTGATSVVGTSGATFYITGVQLEQNTSATPFERRLYNQELANCMRYYYKLLGTATETFIGSGYNNSTTVSIVFIPFLVPMRVTPSSLETTGTASNYAVRIAGGQTNCSVVPSITGTSQYGSGVLLTVASGLSSVGGTLGMFTVSTGYLAWSAEL